MTYHPQHLRVFLRRPCYNAEVVVASRDSNIIPLQHIGHLASLGIGEKVVVTGAHVLHLEVAILVSQRPELVAVHHLDRILALLLCQDNAHAVVALPRRDIEMAADSTALTGVEGVLKPLVWPVGDFLLCLNTGSSHPVFAIGRTDGEGTVEFLLTLSQHHRLTAEVFALQHLDGDG